MRDRSTRFACLLALLALSMPIAEAQDLFLTNARVVDPERSKVIDGNLLILDGKIVGLKKKPPRQFTGTTIDLKGKWVIPGLNDLHTHSYGNMGPANAFDVPGTAQIAERMLYVGVTGFLDLFGSEETLYQLREQQRSGEVGGADLYASLSCLTATKGHCTEYGVPTRVMDSPDDARRVVGELAGKRPDVVKIVYAPSGRMPSIDKATFAAAVEVANARGIRTVVHIQSWEGVADAVEVGASAVTHVPSRKPIPKELARAMAEAGVRSIPTLAVHTDFAHFVMDEEVLAAPLARAVAPETLLSAYGKTEAVERAKSRAESDAESETRVLRSVKTMAAAGVVILTGTDAGNWGTLQGYSVHRELAKLVEAGLTEWQALAAATTRAGDFLGQPLGVAPGDRANLVVLEASPIDDITNTQRIAMVIHHGKLVDRDQPPFK